MGRPRPASGRVRKAQNRGQGGLRPVAGALSDRPRGQRAGPRRAHPLPAGPVVSCAVLRLGAAFLLQPQAGGGGFAALLLRAGAHRKAAPKRPEKQGNMCLALVFSLGLRLMFVDLDKPSVEQKLQCMRPFLIGDTGAAQGCGSGWARGNQPAGLGSEFSHCGHPRLWASVPGHSKGNMCL